jgi:hypothetical protein
MFVLSMKHIKYKRVTVGTTKKSIFARSFLSALRALSSIAAPSLEVSTFSVNSTESLEFMMGQRDDLR